MADEKEQIMTYGMKLPEEPEGPFEIFLSQKRFNSRTLVAFIISLVAITFALYQIFAGYFTQPRPQAHRSMHLAFALILAFLVSPLGRKSWKDKHNWLFLVDLFLIVLVIGIECWIVWDLDAFLDKEGSLTRVDHIIAFTYLILILEATRRLVGWPLVLTTLVFILHAFYAPYFPGILNGPPVPINWFVECQIIYSYGVYPSPLP